MAIAAAAAIATAAVIATIALAFAVYGLLLPEIGPPEAAACVAALFALLVGFGGYVASRGARGPARRKRGVEHETLGLADRLIDLVRDKPFAAMGVALALGVILMRSPRTLGAIARAFFEAVGGAPASER